MTEFEYLVKGPISDKEAASYQLIRQGAVGWTLVSTGNAKEGHLLYFRRVKGSGEVLEAQYEFSESDVDQLNNLIRQFVPGKIKGDDPPQLEAYASKLDGTSGNKPNAALLRRKAKAIRNNRWDVD